MSSSIASDITNPKSLSETELDERGLSATGAKVADTRGQLSWAMFEWSRATYVTLVTIYVFAPYFTNTVIGDPVRGQGMWSLANTLAGLVVALLAPITGAMADRLGRRKPWLAGIMVIMVVSCLALWWVKPAGEGGLPIPVVMTLIVLLVAGFSCGEVFHNSMLPAIVSPQRIGWLSGVGLAVNNFGALIALSAVLCVIALPASNMVDWSFLPDQPWFGLDPDQHEHERIAGPIAAAWLLLFQLPLFLWTPDAQPSGISVGRAVTEGWLQLKHTVKCARKMANVGLFLLARMLFTDGLVAIILYAGIYVSGVFDWDVAAMLLFGLALTPAGVIGGLLGGWIDNRLGSKRSVQIALVGAILSMICAISTTSTQIFFMPYDGLNAKPLWSFPYFQTLPEMIYLTSFVVLVIFIGAIFANSRAMMARISPISMMSQFFGLYAVSGWATAFIGHGLVALTTTVFQSQRAGFASPILLLTAGLVLIHWVKEERAEDIQLP
ncbi:MAG TPA: MFS transporter [Xanthomonadales bacterium]|nr:MFS transporter [Xanthomonadales bacterium]